MTVELSEPVCPCGSRRYEVQSKLDCRHVITGERRFTTAAERDEDPGWYVLPEQRTLYSPDCTTTVCSLCRKLIAVPTLDSIWSRLLNRRIPLHLSGRNGNGIGLAVMNTAALARVNFSDGTD